LNKFQTLTTDVDLRAQIIELATEMDPPPALPDEARACMTKGLTAMNEAKTPADFEYARDTFAKAVCLAPWLGVGYRDLAIACDKAGNYDWALVNLDWYLKTKPAPADADWAKDSRATFEYHKDKAIREAREAAEQAARDRELAAQKAAEDQRAQQEAAAAKEAREQEEFLRKIDGARYSCTYSGKDWADNSYTTTTTVVNIDYLDIRGDTVRWTTEIVQGWRAGRAHQDNTKGRVLKISGRTILDYLPDGTPLQPTGVISADGNTIQFGDRVFKRER
jgi:hypothetical protein